jgi:hypothetical protein
MNVMKILFTVMLFSLLLSQQALAEPGHMITVEDFQYEFMPTGVPTVHMQISNQGIDIEKPDIVVTLSEAVPSMLNDYDYEMRSKVRPDYKPTLLPNKKILVSMMTNKLLKPGNYEALVTIRFSGMKETNRFEFSINQDDIHMAKLKMIANHIEFPINERHSSLWTWLVIVLIFFCVIVAWIKLR